MNTCTIILRESDPTQVLQTVLYYAKKNIQVIGPDDNWREIRVTIRKLLSRNVLTITRIDSAINHDEFFSVTQEMIGFFNGIETPHQEVQRDLVQQIKGVKMALAIHSSQELEAYWDLVTALARLNNGLIFWRGTALINPAGLTVLDTEGNSDLETRTRTYLEDPEEEDDEEFEQEPEYLDSEERRAISNDLLKFRGIPISMDLPVLEEEEDITIRSQRAIMQRVTILSVLNQLAFGRYTGEQVWDYLSRFELLTLLSPKEHAFLANPTEEAKESETWKIEAIWTLMWALGIVEEMGFPNEQCNLNRILPTEYPFKGLEVDPRPFFDFPYSLRGTRAVLDEADLYFRLDWACMKALKEEDDFEEVHPVVVYERLYALFWLMSEPQQDWDDLGWEYD